MTRRQRIPKQRLSEMLAEADLADVQLESNLFGPRRRLLVGPEHAMRLRQASMAWADARRARPGLRLRDWLAEQGLRPSAYAYLDPIEGSNGR